MAAHPGHRADLVAAAEDVGDKVTGHHLHGLRLDQVGERCHTDPTTAGGLHDAAGDGGRMAAGELGWSCAGGKRFVGPVFDHLRNPAAQVRAHPSIAVATRRESGRRLYQLGILGQRRRQAPPADEPVNDPIEARLPRPKHPASPARPPAAPPVA